MSNEYREMSEDELEEIRNSVEQALKSKKNSRRKEVMAQIRDLAASVDLVVDFSDSKRSSTRKGMKVPPKYRNPDNYDQVWAGRGVQPAWVRECLESGRTLEDIAI